MKKYGFTCGLIICMVLILLLNKFPSYAEKSTQDKLNDAKEAYGDIRDRIDSAQDDIAELSDEKSELEQSVGELNDKLCAIGDILGELEKRIDSKKTEIDTTWGHLEDLATQLEEAQNAADSQYKLAKAQIKYMYEQGDRMYVSLLMSADSFSDYLNKNSYIEMMSEYQKEQFILLNKKQKELAGKQSEYEKALIKYEEEKEELDDYEKQVRAEEEKVAGHIKSATDKILEYENQIAGAEAKISKYEEQMRQKEEDIDNLKVTLAKEKEMTALASEAKWRDISDVSVSTDDRYLLANLIYCEAGNEPYVGQVAVGAVVMNRVKSAVFPNTIVGVIYQKGQFTPASSGRLALALAKNSADENCYKAADAALSGVNNVGESLYFRTPSKSVTPKYTIGGHVFY